MNRPMPSARWTSPAHLLLISAVVGCGPSSATDAGTDVSIADAPEHNADTDVAMTTDAIVAVDTAVVVDASVDATGAVDVAVVVEASIDAMAVVDVAVPIDAPIDATVPADTPVVVDATATADATATDATASTTDTPPDAPAGCRSDADCDPLTQFCRADMRCVPRECVPATARCTALGARETCDARGTAYAATPCAPTQSCRDGACLPRVCTPGSLRCAASSFTLVETCAPDGLTYSATPCAPTQSCRDGACLPQVCPPGVLRCSGTTAVHRCAPDGLAYADPTPCPSMSGCDPTANMCAGWTCVPGALSCDGNVARVCNSDGFGHTTTPCSARQTCSAGACLDHVCTPSTRSCVGVDAQRQCNVDGLGYAATPCAAMSSCVDATGVCTPWVCVPGSVNGCRGLRLAVCIASGQDVVATACPEVANANSICVAGACAIAMCSTGYGNCDGSAANGCEVALTTNAAHCGACGRACALPHATAVCAAGACSVGTCEAGYGDCDSDAANGCETDLRSPTACGRCGNACPAGVACRAYVCGGPAGADIALAYAHGCARHATGAVSCWGNNYSGQLGDGTQMGSLTPVPVQGLSDAAQLSASYEHTCTVRVGGAVACWGRNTYGGLGDGTTGARSTVAVTVLGLGDAVGVAAGTDFTCALREAGTVSCWGVNTHGQLGNNSLANTSTPVLVADLGAVTQIAAGLRHACARLLSGAVVCWGANDAGQLGNGSTMNSLVPVAVVGLTDAVEVSAGIFHSCARRASGTVVCWGANDLGQLGRGSAGASSPTPAPVVDLSDAVQVSAGAYHSCARRASGAVVCWGSNGGALGNGMTVNSPRPVTVAGLTDAAWVVAGFAGSGARRAGGEVVRWGANEDGRLGGPMRSILVPTAIAGFP